MKHSIDKKEAKAIKHFLEEIRKNVRMEQEVLIQKDQALSEAITAMVPLELSSMEYMELSDWMVRFLRGQGILHLPPIPLCTEPFASPRGKPSI